MRPTKETSLQLSQSHLLNLYPKRVISKFRRIGITLSALVSKIYNSMVFNRVFPLIDPILRQNQNGFRKGRSTVPQILTIRRIIEELKIPNREASIVFVDFAKAFDSADRKALLHILYKRILYNKDTLYPIGDCQSHCHHAQQSVNFRG